MLPFNLVIPPSRGGRGRKRSRRPAQGLTLTAARIEPSRLHGGASRNLATELHDVGWGGVRFSSSEPLNRGARIDLKIREQATGESLHARGEVVWVDSRTVNGRPLHLVGAKFDEVLSAPAKSAWFYERWVATHRLPWESQQAKRASKPRASDRFAASDCDVTLERDHRFRAREKAGNLASRLLDLSRTGAQVACVDPVKRLERMRLTVNFRTFADIFTVEAETVWVVADEDGTWRVGLAFGALNRAQERQMVALEQWFRGRKP